MKRRFIEGGHRDNKIEPYSDRLRAQQFEDEPLPIEIIVKVQQLAARGRTVDQIVQEMKDQRVPRDAVIRILNEDPPPRAPRRPQRAGVGFPGFKNRTSGYGP